MQPAVAGSVRPVFRPVRVLVPLLLALSVVGCRARADVLVAVEPDGSGTVAVTATLDPDAVAQVGDVAAAVKVDDLRSAGWKVVGPKKAGADTFITVSKPFAEASRLGAVLEELGGPDGPFPGWKLTSSNSFTVSSYELTGKIRLTGSLDQFSDGEVAAALDGFATGRSPEELTAALQDDPDALTLNVAVTLPGDLDDVSGLDRRDPDANSAAKQFRLGDGRAVDTAVELKSSSTDRSAVLWVILGGGLIVASALLFVAGRQQARRRRGRRPAAAE